MIFINVPAFLCFVYLAGSTSLGAAWHKDKLSGRMAWTAVEGSSAKMAVYQGLDFHAPQNTLLPGKDDGS